MFKHIDYNEVAVVSSDESSDVEPLQSKSEPLPEFQIRPLSDTPCTSIVTSPSYTFDETPDISPIQSSTNLNGLVPPRKRRPTTIDVPGLTKSKTSPDGTISKEDPGSKLVIVMVGLPATGKSFITNKLSRYLNYSLYHCRVFNVGNTRRQANIPNEQDSKFFNPENPEAVNLREKWAMDTLDQLLDYLLEDTGSVGIFDATNSTKARRKHVLDKIHERNSQLKVLFLESVCSDNNVVENNVKLKLCGPDYKGKDREESLKDFRGRLDNYRKAYEAIEDDEELQYIKMIDVGKKVIAYNIQGFLASQTVYYLLNFNLCERQIWITRNGESQDNVSGRIGGDSELTARGVKYSQALARFINDQRVQFEENHPDTNFVVWSSMLQRAVQTCEYFNEEFSVKQMRMLDELSAGKYEGMTYEEIQRLHPADFQERLKDKIRYRYPGIGGESYLDVINRLRPVITEIERITDNVLLVTHRVVARVLLGYFLNLSRDVMANLDVPLHHVYCLEPRAYGVSWKLYRYDEHEDYFVHVPEHELNTTKVVEMGVPHHERKYSVVPTAPPQHTKLKSFSMVKSASSGDKTPTASSTDLRSLAGDGFQFDQPVDKSSNQVSPGSGFAGLGFTPTLGPAHGVQAALAGGSSRVPGRLEQMNKQRGAEIDKLAEKLSKLNN